MPGLPRLCVVLLGDSLRAHLVEGQTAVLCREMPLQMETKHSFEGSQMCPKRGRM